jgi:hypothetical protein
MTLTRTVAITCFMIWSFWSLGLGLIYVRLGYLFIYLFIHIFLLLFIYSFNCLFIYLLAEGNVLHPNTKSGMASLITVSEKRQKRFGELLWVEEPLA